MEEKHAEWVGNAHSQYPKKILPAMIVNPLKGMGEISKVVHYHETYGVRCLRIPRFGYTLPPPQIASTGRFIPKPLNSTLP